MDAEEQPPAFDLLLVALGIVLFILCLILIERKILLPSAAASNASRATPSVSPVSCIAGHSCLVEDLHCADAALVCKNHFWSSSPCVEDDPCPPNNICKSIDQTRFVCDPGAKSTLTSTTVETRQSL